MSETDKRTTFWMVWRENSCSTRYQHQTKQHAVDEADRLARQNPGETFYVLKSTAAVMAELPPIRRLKMTRDPIPF